MIFYFLNATCNLSTSLHDDTNVTQFVLQIYINENRTAPYSFQTELNNDCIHTYIPIEIIVCTHVRIYQLYIKNMNLLFLFIQHDRDYICSILACTNFKAGKNKI